MSEWFGAAIKLENRNLVTNALVYHLNTRVSTAVLTPMRSWSHTKRASVSVALVAWAPEPFLVNWEMGNGRPGAVLPGWLAGW